MDGPKQISSEQFYKLLGNNQNPDGSAKFLGRFDTYNADSDAEDAPFDPKMDAIVSLQNQKKFFDEMEKVIDQTEKVQHLFNMQTKL
jgi:hypothetical protein